MWLHDVGPLWRLTFDEFPGDEALVAARTKDLSGALYCNVEVYYPDRYGRIETDAGRRQCRIERRL